VAARRNFLLRSLLTLAALALVLYFSAPIWLGALGRALVFDEGPAPADAALVLGGDFTGARILRAAQLVRSGFVPVVLVSGPVGMFGLNEADAAIHFITARGCPAEWFIPVRHTATSTREEANVLLAELARRNLHSVDIVTSNFHSRRARRVFLEVEKQRGGGPRIRMIAAADPDYDPASWWRTREGRKTAFYEWTKTVTSLLGI